MLRLEKMELCGFKSFGERTELRFPRGITAVVGPNGCGKSNLGDAINWVLGEQSPKMLRGSQMADVIFGGSEGRKPLGLAEVSLHLEGGAGLVGGDGRVVITRRLFRSGESEYLLNGARSRLKDIQELLREGKVGARTYATIEQGKIDQVLNAKPKDRRALIEDAAGVAGYKHKRRLAELKLEATHANLLRVNDIITEVTRQINSLKRQAAKARRYRRLREILREKERLRFGQRALELERELATCREREAGARASESEAAAGLARSEAEIETRRGRLEEARRAHGDLSLRLHELDIAIDRGEAQVRTCRERIGEAEQTMQRESEEDRRIAARRIEVQEAHASGRGAADAARAELSRIEGELAERQQAAAGLDAARLALRQEVELLRRSQFDAVSHVADSRNRLRRVEEAIERASTQRERLVDERERARVDWSRLHDAASELAGTARDHASRAEELERSWREGETVLERLREQGLADGEVSSRARERQQSALATLSTLEDVETRFAGVADGVKSLLGAAARNGIRVRGVVADYLEASRDIEGAAEGYLQWLLPTVILEDDADAHRAAEFLRAEGAGRTCLISGTQPAGALAVGTPGNGSLDVPPEIFEDSRVLGRLRDRLTLKASANGAVADRIGDAVLVGDLAAALDLHRRFPRVDYLTPAGEVVYASGVIAAGGGSATERGLLAHQRRLREASAEASAAAAAAAAAERCVEEGREALARLEAEQRTRRAELDTAERRRVELAWQVERASDETERSGRRSEVLAEELAALDEELERLRSELEAGRVEARQADELQGELGARLVAQAAALEQCEQEAGRLSETLARLGAEVAAGGQRHEALEREARRLAAEVQELEGRRAALASAVEQAGRRAAENRELAESTAREIVELDRERHALRQRAGELEREVSEGQREMQEGETALRQRRVELEALREATRAAELERTRAESARAHLDDLCRQELGLEAGAAAAAVGEDAGEVDLQALEHEVQEIRQRIEALGPVNMAAIEEFGELEQRHGFLAAQKQDLEQSMTSLRETIRRINRQSREHFIEAFEAIRRSYQEVYRLLFNGGRADLQLEEGEDVLECGIEILAQPPGKRLSGVQLLSGGEKALSAIALLFAIFRYQPSPFCLLDEVDAALDDANVGRFARMVREYASNTQFIIITHNKLSMESADLLYGVTMQEPGVSTLVSLELQ